nr:dual specificity protein phosphatase 14-like [Ciona intestinalis]|eukprot:XP_002125487.1 dual specificity protein phosphatase 14-like [Ciona intestinalis]
MNSIHEITPTLYLCGVAALQNKESVLNKRIGLIVNATIDLGNQSWNGKIDIVRVPVNDVPTAQLSPYFDKVADLLHKNCQNGTRCLVHCVAGVSRSATLCIVYLMKYHRMSLRDAHTHVKSRRPFIRPNAGFWKQLVEYEKKIYGRNSVKMVQSSIGLIPDVYVAETRNMVPFFGRSRR